MKPLKQGKRPMKPTIENLRTYGAKPLTRWLISVAKERTAISYGTAKHRLETEHGFGTIFSPMMGQPAGAAMDNIHAVVPDAPLLNILLVQQGDQLPGDGAGYYMAQRFHRPVLAQQGARKRRRDLWKTYFNRAANEVYTYQDWERLFQKVYDEPFEPDPQVATRRAGNDGSERDGLPRGRSGEGRNHKSLRLWVWKNQEIIAPTIRDSRGETEVELLSGDRVDVVYYADNSTLAIEVKSRDSNEADLRRGIYQCVKYQAVLRAQDPRYAPRITALLVTELPLSRNLLDLARKLGVRHQLAPYER